jgi:protein-S-isoprenylcysteine O-methyltransferase Ste14
MYPGLLFAAAWTAFIVSWLVVSFWSGRTEKRLEGREVGIYRAFVIVGAVLFYHRTSSLLHAPRLWHVGLDGAYALAGLTCAGFLFAAWARLRLGSLWSADIARKEGHIVIDTGPYALVRHPIYTGILCATLATGAAKATLPAILGAVCITVGIWLKARLEERFLAAELVPGDYASYRRRVPMLVPFFPGG